jgi:hypothetical protein
VQCNIVYGFKCSQGKGFTPEGSNDFKYDKKEEECPGNDVKGCYVRTINEPENSSVSKMYIKI